MARILMTGAAGRIGTAIGPLLAAHGHRLVLLDVVPPSVAAGAERTVIASATDEAAMTEAARGADLLLHLASFAAERTWREIVETNIESARVALDAARSAGVPVTLLASSVHAVGFVPSDESGETYVPPRPDSYYGLSKVVAEALGSLYADRFGMRVVSARIMAFDDRPHTARALSTWLSPADLVRLVEASLDAPVGNAVVWGVSANTRRTVSLTAGRAIGYEPEDDAEHYAHLVAADLGLPTGADVPHVGTEPLGDGFADRSRPLGAAW